MSRRRYLSTNISLDKVVNRLATEYGDFAALFYTWMIPHANDLCELDDDPEELMALVTPHRRDKTPEDISYALEGMANLELIERVSKKISFHPESFYEYQSYIPVAKRKSPNNTEEHRTSAQDTEDRLYPSPSPSPSPNLLKDPPAPAGKPPVAGLETWLLKYSPEQQNKIYEYFEMLRFTRKTAKIVDSVRIKELDYWDHFPPDIVVAGLEIHLRGHTEKQEDYTRGIIRRLKREEAKPNETHVATDARSPDGAGTKYPMRCEAKDTS